MRLRRLSIALLPGLAALLLAACAVPERSNETEVATAPRDCEPQTGTRVPASCTRPRGSASTSTGTSNVQTIERPTRIDIR